ncbi:hypothetical protein CEXT_484731 [Caerostris extrusa]|uniref:Uncharacterized protein n=1 Tax=Caerostris extrusa TaxID=172846 RepID=A0AAV4RCK5_CAEEX|nr:hypothetical protein CEXT_484731 [Caerostris extrusa]
MFQATSFLSLEYHRFTPHISQNPKFNANSNSNINSHLHSTILFLDGPSKTGQLLIPPSLGRRKKGFSVTRLLIPPSRGGHQSDALDLFRRPVLFREVFIYSLLFVNMSCSSDGMFLLEVN